MIIILFFLFISFNSQCFKDIKWNEQNNGLQQEVDLLLRQENLDYNCIEQLIKYDYLDLSMQLFNKFCQNSKCQSQIYNTVQKQKNKLIEFANKIQQKEVQIIEPVYRWGQSYEQVFIQVKFAHRFDAPGCMKSENTQVEIGQDWIKLNSKCLSSNQPIQFELNLKLYNEIDYKKSSWKLESVGTLLITIQKEIPNKTNDDQSKDSEIWIRLLEEKKKVAIWLDIKNKAMEKYFDILDQIEDQNFKKEL